MEKNLNIQNRSFKIPKISTTVSLVLVSIMWYIFAGNSLNPDYNNYKTLYNYINLYDIKEYKGIEYSVFLLMKIAGYFDLSYQQFLFIVATIFLTLMYRFISKTSKAPNLVMIMFIYFPFFLDIVQIRNSLAYAIVLNGLIFLMDKKYFKFIFFVIFASSFHNTSIFYLTLLLFKVNWRYLLGIIMIVISGLIFLYQPLLSAVTLFFPAGVKYLIYLGGIRYDYLLIYSALLLFNVFMNVSLEDRFLYLSKNQKISGERLEFAKFSKQLSLVILVIIPLLSINANFFRLYRNLLVVFLINFLNYISLKKYIKNIYFFLFDFIYLIYFIVIGYYFLYWNMLEKVFYQILQNNIFN